ncbi:MAG TPA: Hsp20/alpha crystallin family protein [Acidimicrobiales bacterium]|nr:Hsp20/alpha crystallin family protein [Acidimicrobiales bacterium]
MALVKREHLELPELWRRFFDPEADGSWLRVEEFVDGDALVVRTELPGIDPDKDVEITISDGMLHIRARREEKSEHKARDGYRSEFRYGSFVRTMSLPAGTKEDDVKATYGDGILEIRVPVGEEAKTASTRVPVVRR